MRSIGLLVNLDKPHAPEALRRISALADTLGVELLAEPAAVALAGGGAAWRACRVEEIAEQSDAIAVFGGDGTLLRAVHQTQGADVPLMGFNIGSLGYLTGVDSSRFEEAFRALAAGTFQISERPLLSCAVRRAGIADAEAVPRDALNEIVLARGSGRIVKISMALDGVPVTTYACDGLIVSTPTGSTAYSLSAGGPLVMPGAAATVVTVICPHTLGSRPLVVADTARIALRVDAAEVPLPLTIDGEDTAELAQGDEVEIIRSPRCARIAFLPDHNDYLALSRKLGWGGKLG